MSRNELVVLGLSVLAVLLVVGTAYAMSGPSGMGWGTSGMMGSRTSHTSMMGSGSGYTGGMMGGNNGMMRGSMMGNYNSSNPCSQMMSGGTMNLNGTGAFVSIVGNGFHPSLLTVAKGTVVTWINMDFVQHTVTSGTEQAPTGMFDSHELSHMQGFSYKFDVPGTYTYYCDIHPYMVGTVVVTG